MLNKAKTLMDYKLYSLDGEIGNPVAQLLATLFQRIPPISRRIITPAASYARLTAMNFCM